MRDQSKQEGDTQAIWVRRKGKIVNVGKYPQEDKDDK
jgi:hypothetical protein